MTSFREQEGCVDSVTGEAEFEGPTDSMGAIQRRSTRAKNRMRQARGVVVSDASTARPGSSRVGASRTVQDGDLATWHMENDTRG